MQVTEANKRFLKNWEEQREGGKKVYVATYTFGLTILIFLCTAALGLFMSLPFVKVKWLIIIGVSSLVAAFVLSLVIWSSQQKKYQRISDQLKAEAN